MQPMSGKTSKWKRLNCFRKKSADMMKKKTATMDAAATPTQKQSKLGLCMRSLVCCKRTNKVRQKTGDSGKSCRCCPCFGRKSSTSSSNAWSTDAVPPATPGSFCSRLCNRIMCCRKKPKADMRRTSQLSKKPSIGPTVQTENKPTIDASLVDSNSMMKGAIPILKVPLAWICLILNVLVPGLGTILSGWFCLCFGIPRFSAHDSLRGRLGSFLISHIVGISQAFTIIFCLVGWGWSIWWGTIMLNLARKHKQLVAEAAAAENVEGGSKQSIRTGMAAQPPVLSQNHER